MITPSDLVGHPGLAPLLWWIVGLAAALDLLYAASAIARYRRMHPGTPEARHTIWLELAGRVSLNNGAVILLLMVQLLSIGEVPFPVFFISTLLGLINIFVSVVAP